jgi:hypothetical protein
MLILLTFLGFAGCLAFIAGSGGGGSGSGAGEVDYATAKKRAVPIGETVSSRKVA